MILPRNAFVRHTARTAGALLGRADGCDWTRCVTKSHPEGYWLLDDPDRYVYRAARMEDRAHAWRRVPWCPVWIGDAIEDGERLATGLVWGFATFGLLPAGCIVTVGAAVYGLMVVGAAVLR